MDHAGAERLTVVGVPAQRAGEGAGDTEDDPGYPVRQLTSHDSIIAALRQRVSITI